MPGQQLSVSLDHEQMIFCNMVAEVEHSLNGSAKCLAILSNDQLPMRIRSLHPPCLFSMNEEVYSTHLGMTQEELIILQNNGVI